jgi:hypothetical protein
MLEPCTMAGRIKHGNTNAEWDVAIDSTGVELLLAGSC